MNRRRWLVSGPPRTGGHLLLGLIRSAGVLALHTHNPRYRTRNDSMATLIKLRRRNIFAALMSNCLVWHTGQSTDYIQLEVEPFQVSLAEFRTHYAGHLYHHAIDIKEARFNDVVDMYLEDFQHNHYCALEQLGLTNVGKIFDQSLTKLIHNKSPYDYRDIVINHHELLQYFTWMRTQHITTLGLINPFDRPPRQSKKKQIFT